MYIKWSVNIVIVYLVVKVIYQHIKGMPSIV